jgi:hypothetical protein
MIDECGMGLTIIAFCLNGAVAPNGHEVAMGAAQTVSTPPPATKLRIRTDNRTEGN